MSAFTQRTQDICCLPATGTGHRVNFPSQNPQNAADKLAISKPQDYAIPAREHITKFCAFPSTLRRKAVFRNRLEKLVRIRVASPGHNHRRRNNSNFDFNLKFVKK
jgi:hypothetical protein